MGPSVGEISTLPLMGCVPCSVSSRVPRLAVQPHLHMWVAEHLPVKASEVVVTHQQCLYFSGEQETHTALPACLQPSKSRGVYPPFCPAELVVGQDQGAKREVLNL